MTPSFTNNNEPPLKGTYSSHSIAELQLILSDTTEYDPKGTSDVSKAVKAEIKRRNTEKAKKEAF